MAEDERELSKGLFYFCKKINHNIFLKYFFLLVQIYIVFVVLHSLYSQLLFCSHHLLEWSLNTINKLINKKNLVPYTTLLKHIKKNQIMDLEKLCYHLQKVLRVVLSVFNYVFTFLQATRRMAITKLYINSTSYILFTALY